jgi:peptidyl-prolyl cis-trans isomerase A (cyclophilin A)
MVSRRARFGLILACLIISQSSGAQSPAAPTVSPTVPPTAPAVAAPTVAAPAVAAPVAPTPATEPEAPPVVAPEPTAKPAQKATRHLKRITATVDLEIDGKPEGSFRILLYVDKVPKTVENFIGLAEGTKSFKPYDAAKAKYGIESVVRPFYNGLGFHRIVPGYVVQGGCPIGNGRGGPGFSISDESHPDLHHNAPGMVSMARGREKDSAGSQFFITLAALPHLDGKFTVFGKVIEGMDVVKKISQVKRNAMDEKPLVPVIMKKVSITREYL